MADIKTISEGLAIKIQEVFGPLLEEAMINKDIIFCPTDIAQRIRAEQTAGTNKPATENKEKYKFEFLSFWLQEANLSWERNRTPLARHGLNIGTTTNGIVKYRMVKAVPIDLVYTLTLWTLKKERADAFIKEYCFLQFDNPQIQFFWEGDKPLEMDFFVRPNVRMADSVGKMFVEGKYYRPEVTFLVEGWLLKDIPISFAKTINLDLYASESLVNTDDLVKVFHATETV